MTNKPSQFFYAGIIIFLFLIGIFYNLPVFGVGNGQTVQIEVVISGETPTPTPTPTPTATPTATATPPPAGGGGGPILPLPPQVLERIDVNGDGKVDIIDLSIMLFYFDKPGFLSQIYDLNNDGKFDLIDISIFLYYWTG